MISDDKDPSQLINSISKICGIQSNLPSNSSIPEEISQSQDEDQIFSSISQMLSNKFKNARQTRHKSLVEDKIIETILNFERILKKQKECGEECKSTEDIIVSLRQSLGSVKLETAAANLSLEKEGRLKSIFHTYIKDKSLTKIKSFDQKKENTMSINEFTKFLRDYKVSLSIPKIRDIFKKHAELGKLLQWEQFITVLPLVADEEHKETIELSMKKVSLGEVNKTDKKLNALVKETQKKISALEAMTKEQVITAFWKNIEDGILNIEIASPAKKCYSEAYSPSTKSVSMKDFKAELDKIKKRRSEEHNRKKRQKEDNYQKNSAIIKEMYEKQKLERSISKASVNPTKHTKESSKQSSQQENYIEKMTLKDLGIQYRQTDFIASIDDDDDIEVMKKFKVIDE